MEKNKKSGFIDSFLKFTEDVADESGKQAQMYMETQKQANYIKDNVGAFYEQWKYLSDTEQRQKDKQEIEKFNRKKNSAIWRYMILYVFIAIITIAICILL